MTRHTVYSPARGLLAAMLLLAAACASLPAGRETSSDRVLLVTGSTIVTMDPAGTIVAGGAVAIRGPSIAAVGPRAELERRFPKARRLETDGIVLPGLINAHTHAPMTLFRGLADDLELMDWLHQHIFPAEAAWVDDEFVRWGTRLACLEMLLGGVTTFADMYYFEDAIAEEVETCGLRAVLGQTLIDFPAPDYATWSQAFAATRKFIERWRGHPRVTPAVAPHAAYTVSPEHLVEAHALAEDLDVPLLIHLAEDRSEVEQVSAAQGMRPVRYLDGLGILDRRLLAAHVVWPDRDEITLLAKRQVGIAHCPQSNMKVAAGVAPVPDFLAAGIAVGLGTDGAASNNDLNLWEEMDTAAKLHKVHRSNPTLVSARDALRMATIGGARALGLGDLTGSLEPGKRADLIVVDRVGSHQTPYYDAYSLLVYSTKASDVRTVIVDGEILVRDRQALTIDAPAVLARAGEYGAAIAARAASATSGSP